MPELPDIVVYIESLEARILGQTLERVKILNPCVLRSVMPALEAAHEKSAYSGYRLGKRVVIGLQSDYFLVIHLMIAGRLRWIEYCARCQTGGVILADRALWRLLKKSWPRALEDIE